MYKLFFDNKIITFTQNTANCSPTAVCIDDTHEFEITKVLQKVENSNPLEIISDNAAELFGRFCSKFRILEAAGGAVVCRGKVLMIFRGGRWDLPKGHIERGESREVCAVREVAEECGVPTPEIVRYVTSTRHIYAMHGEWFMKLTHWYQMSLAELCPTTPQREEGIEIAEWVDTEQVAERLKNSYSTIAEVIHNAQFTMHNEKNYNL